jgi:probable HAF family extracellular repeat protein
MRIPVRALALAAIVLLTACVDHEPTGPLAVIPPGAASSVVMSGAVISDLGICAHARAINATGAIAGDCSGNAFIWKDGAVTYLEGLPAGSYSQARGINASGHVVGHSGPFARPVLWKDGTVTDLGTFDESHVGIANAINNAGDIVGQEGGLTRPVLWRENFLMALGCLEGTMYACFGEAYDINNHGQVVGRISNVEGDGVVPFLWQDGTMVSLGNLPGAHTGWGRSINDNGVVVGWMDFEHGPRRSFLWDDGTMIDLGLIPDHTDVEAFDINDSGQVVGRAWKTAGGYSAFVWEAGTFTLLPDLAVPYSEALAINNHGVVAGSSYSHVGFEESVIWHPFRSFAPAAPEDFSGEATSPTEVALQWTHQVGNRTFFEIGVRSRDEEGAWSTWSVWGTTTYAATSAWIHSREPDTAYRFRIRSCTHSNNCSAFVTGQVVRTPIDAPGTPTQLVGSATSATSIDLSWSAHGATAADFRIQRRIRPADEDWGSWELLATVAGDLTAYTDAHATPSAHHRYRIRACNSGGCSEWETSANIRTPAEAPPAPADVVAAAQSPGSILVSWTGTSSSGDFVVQRRTREDGTWGSWEAVGTVPWTDNSFLDGDVLPGTTHRYRVRACAGPCSEWALSPIVTTPEAAPSAPHDVEAIAVSSSRIDLSWAADGGANEFSLQRRVRIDGEWGSWEPLATAGGGDRAYVDSGVAGDTRYRYRLRACNAGGCSAWSVSPPVGTPAN